MSNKNKKHTSRFTASSKKPDNRATASTHGDLSKYQSTPSGDSKPLNGDGKQTASSSTPNSDFPIDLSTSFFCAKVGVIRVEMARLRHDTRHALSHISWLGLAILTLQMLTFAVITYAIFQ
ncbi:MAG: hypothetical protein IJW12_03235 [Opitutales bacterium]|nr:hypothetical protein [Opitutales bacterium]